MANTQANQQQLTYGDLIIEEMAAQQAELLKQITFLKIENRLRMKEKKMLSKT